MREETPYDRRSFLGSAAMTIAAAKLAMALQTQKPNDLVTQTRAGRNTSFDSPKQIDAGIMVVTMEARPGTV